LRMNTIRLLVVGSIGLVVASLLLLSYWSPQVAAATGERWLSEAGTPAGLESLKARVSQMEHDHREKLQVKGIYVPGNLVPTEAFPRLVSLVERTELNAMVIDVKSDEGYIYYDSQLPLVDEIGAERIRIKDPPELLRTLKQKGIYTIARLVVFKDSQLGRSKPAWAVQRPGGQPWRDRTGQIWMDAYNEHVWGYNIAVACEAASLGFDEVQFDYVRFPSDGRVREARYPAGDDRHASVVISQFLERAADRLDLCGAYSSADIFGQIPSVVYDMGIGQQWELLGKTVDYLSPMAYPSHYGPNVYGLPDPDAAPGQTVFRTMEDAYNKYDQLLREGLSEKVLEQLGTVPDGLVAKEQAELARVRPWLQDFSMRHTYGPAQVRAQIEAVYRAGGSQWLLWNPGGRYTEGALEPAEEEDQEQ